MIVSLAGFADWMISAFEPKENFQIKIIVNLKNL